MVGDRVLIKPLSPKERTKSGLFLPPGVEEKNNVQIGYVVKVGPGYPIPALTDNDEPWKEKTDDVKYVPLQPKIGDKVVYVQNSGWEIDMNKERFVILPHSAVLMMIRDEGLIVN